MKTQKHPKKPYSRAQERLHAANHLKQWRDSALISEARQEARSFGIRLK